MNGMIDFYLQTCLGQSYFDGQLFVRAHMESLRRRKKKKKNTFVYLQTLGKPQILHLFAQPPISRLKVAFNLPGAGLLAELFQVQAQVSGNIPWPMAWHSR